MFMQLPAILSFSMAATLTEVKSCGELKRRWWWNKDRDSLSRTEAGLEFTWDNSFENRKVISSDVWDSSKDSDRDFREDNWFSEERNMKLWLQTEDNCGMSRLHKDSRMDEDTFNDVDASGRGEDDSSAWASSYVTWNRKQLICTSYLIAILKQNTIKQ